MHLLRGDDDGLGAGGTGLLAGAAADAILLLDRRKQHPPLFRRNDGVSGTGLAAGAAMGLLQVHHAPRLEQVDRADARLLLVDRRQRRDGPAGADQAAGMASEIAVPDAVIQPRLQNACNAVSQIGGNQYPGRADIDAEMAGGAATGEMSQALSPRRDNRHRVHRYSGRSQTDPSGKGAECGAANHRRPQQELPAGRVFRLRPPA